jgi:hypothetical protein
MTIWRRVDDILTRRTSRSVLIMTSEAEEPLKLEGAAIDVWDELRQPATDVQLVAAISSRLELAEDEVRVGVVTTREALMNHGALAGSDD